MTNATGMERLRDKNLKFPLKTPEKLSIFKSSPRAQYRIYDIFFEIIPFALLIFTCWLFFFIARLYLLSALMLPHPKITRSMMLIKVII